jgi:hypothetical protein
MGLRLGAYFIVVEEYDAVETSGGIRAGDNPITGLPPNIRAGITTRWILLGVEPSILSTLFWPW